MAVIGIDLGTTNSLAGVWQDGKGICGQCGKRNACNTAV